MDVIKDSSTRFAWLAPFFFAVIVGSMLLFGYWHLDKTPPITDVQVRYIGIDPQKPEIGWLEWSGHHRERACKGTAYSFLTGGIRVELPRQDLSYDGPVEPHDPKKKTQPLRWWTSFTIPRDLAGEEVTLRTQIHWQCNPLQEHFAPFVESVPDTTLKLPAKPVEKASE